MPRRIEDEIHLAIANHLLLRAYEDVIWWHTPNGERRDARTGAKLKRMGVKPGIPDFLFFRAGQLYFIEQKSSNGRHTKSQREMTANFLQQEALGIVSYSLDESLSFLEQHNLIKSNGFPITAGP